MLPFSCVIVSSLFFSVTSGCAVPRSKRFTSSGASQVTDARGSSVPCISNEASRRSDDMDSAPCAATDTLRVSQTRRSPRNAADADVRRVEDGHAQNQLAVLRLGAEASHDEQRVGASGQRGAQMERGRFVDERALLVYRLDSARAQRDVLVFWTASSSSVPVDTRAF